MKPATVAATNLAISSEMAIVGGTPLKGEIAVQGAKNSVSKCMVAAMLTAEPCVLKNVPNIDDVHVVSEMIRALGGTVEEISPGTLCITARTIKEIAPTELRSIAGRSRIPILFAGPMLARSRHAMVPELGGCKIGPRPVDFHLKALEQLGAHIEHVPKGFVMHTPGLIGNRITLPYPSVGATEQILFAATLAEGVTVIANAAVEPEIIDLIALLQKMGAIISVDTDRTVTIIGVRELHGYDHTVMPDRLEAASWACAAIATDGRITVRNARQLDMTTFLNKYQQIGGAFEIHDDGITFSRGRDLTSIAIETDVHPGFMTDWQQPFVVALTQARGASVVHETVYENRFGFTDALVRMGANIQLYRECLGGKLCRFGQKNHLHSAIIMGPTPLTGARISIPDLRAGFSYIVAALTARGETTIEHMEIIGRGYERFSEKLLALGARIVRG